MSSLVGVGGAQPVGIAGTRALNAYFYQNQALGQPRRIVLGSNLDAVATGSIFAEVAGRFNHTVEVIGTFSATLNIMGSEDGVEFLPMQPAAILAGTASGANITTAGLYLFRAPLLYIRCDVTAYTSGSVQLVYVVSTM